ncbi:MAG TPA: protein-glutamate O-methyltransferase CheR [Chthonomonas sp.]|uniref:CheR family methyltransferase n=1 Tax=Chthonomonas sp. TaxID=2282153 RepID=UPI002B4B8F4D|nr:protein-glutamate O-methyltransferase CheR [Chthonomonas sp.]HLI47324.1 protein-glutamate O-methyltransferase CheR [Chthonomonas sp.]
MAFAKTYLQEHDETDARCLETADYSQFKACILRKTGIDLNLYRQQQMHRRLWGLVERAGKKSFMEYYALLEQDPQEYALFLDRLTINVSELFRNPEKWQELRTHILPELLAQGGPLRVWSAGCSYGAEPYSLAILLDQIAPERPHRILATDLDRSILKKAQQGRFTRADVRHVEPNILRRYFEGTPNASLPADADACYTLCPRIRDRVTFRAHNLLCDPFEKDFDLICCRNVVIYFTEEAKETLYQRFYDALKPGGYLFVGGSERIFRYREIGFDSPLPFFYRKRGDAPNHKPLKRT